MNLYQINEGDYEHFAEFLPSAGDCVSITFKTRWADAKDPFAFQNKLQIILSKDEMRSLGQHLIEQASK